MLSTMLSAGRPLVAQHAASVRARAPVMARNGAIRGPKRSAHRALALSVAASSNPLRPGETPEQANVRRSNESNRVEERMKVRVLWQSGFVFLVRRRTDSIQSPAKNKICFGRNLIRSKTEEHRPAAEKILPTTSDTAA